MTPQNGRISIQGARFVASDGTTWPYRGADDFSLYHRFLVGENIDPILAERAGLGANILRVFACYADPGGIGKANGLGPLDPRRPGYYEGWKPFKAKLSRYGLRAEVTHGDLQQLMLDEEAHVRRLRDELTGDGITWFLEINEPFKNIIGGGARSYALLKTIQGHPDLLLSSGDYLIEGPRKVNGKWVVQSHLQHLDYVTVHIERKWDWVRTCRALAEIRDGFSWEVEENGVKIVVGQFAGVKVPVVGNEPTGFDEVPRGDSRSSTQEHAAQHAAGCQLFGAGATFHSDDGIASRLLRPVTMTCAKAWFTGALFAPPDCQFAGYQRGSAGGGAGIGNMPLEHRDLGESVQPKASRTYAKEHGGAEYAVACQPDAGWTAVPRDGWKVADEPARGLVRLTR